jgi:hypothetical protein
MAEEKKETTGFKVVDRRSFSDDGTLRTDAKETPKESRQSLKNPPAFDAADPAQPASLDEGEYFDGSATSFDTLVSYLSTTVLFQLGLLPGPSGERIPPDTVNARRTIDLLEILQLKTRGNLTPDEVKLLEDVLYELRMSYVEIEKRRSKKAK